MDKKNNQNETADKRKKLLTKTMDRILLIVGIFLFLFTVITLAIYQHTGGIPDTLVACVFACCGCEAGIMGWIKNVKEKYRERDWEKEDKKGQEDVE